MGRELRPNFTDVDDKIIARAKEREDPSHSLRASSMPSMRTMLWA